MILTYLFSYITVVFVTNLLSLQVQGIFNYFAYPYVFGLYSRDFYISRLSDFCSQVVSQLKATCNGLSEEQLAKLGVALFNCQSEVEGRRTFLCTEEMVQCTLITVFKTCVRVLAESLAHVGQIVHDSSELITNFCL